MSEPSLAQDPRPWLPNNALSDGVLTRHLRQYCEDWSRLWFSNSSAEVRIASRSISRARFDPKTLAWRSACSRLFLLIEPASADAVGLALLGADKSAKKLKSEDQSLLRELTRGALDSFAGVLERNLKIECGRAAHDGAQLFDKAIAFEIILMSKIKIELFLEHDLAIQWRKRTIAPTKESGALCDRRDAIGVSDVTLGAFLGRSTIALAELNALSPGDIIITDTECGARVPLCVDALVHQSRSCVLRHGPAGLELHL